VIILNRKNNLSIKNNNREETEVFNGRRNMKKLISGRRNLLVFFGEVKEIVFRFLKRGTEEGDIQIKGMGGVSYV